MSHLTKEELQEIKRCLKYMITGGTTPYSIVTIQVKKKIQSMIDNYCDHKHEPSDAQYKQFIWHVCQKCGASYKEV